MSNHEDNREHHDQPVGSLMPIDSASAQAAFAEIEAGVVMMLHPTIMRHEPAIEAKVSGEALSPLTQLGWYHLIVMGYPNDLKYFNALEQGTFAYLRSVELRAQGMGIEVPIIDTPVILAYDNDLVGLDRNMKELEREQRVSDQMFTEFSQTADPDKIGFIYSRFFYKDGQAGRLRYPALSRGLETIGEREKGYVDNFRRSRLYVDEAHERAFLLPASILHDMFRIKEQHTDFQRALGE